MMRIHACVVTDASHPPQVQLFNLDTRQSMTLLRPLLCGTSTGLHYMPKQDDRVIVFYWAEQTAVIIGGFSFLSPASISSLVPNDPLAGETWLYGPKNNKLSLVTNGNVNVVTPVGAFFTVNGKKVVLDGDSVSASGGDPQGGTVSVSGSVTGSGR